MAAAADSTSAKVGNSKAASVPAGDPEETFTESSLQVQFCGHDPGMTDTWRSKLHWPPHLPTLPVLPWRRIAAGFAVVVAVLVFVAPVRRAVAFGTSRVILWMASPITPFVPNFDKLPDTTRLLAADGSEIAALSGDNGRRQIVGLETIPEHVRRAVLAAEDADFYEHSGTNPLSLIRAVGATALGRTQGGSTITQQLAKLNYTGGQRSLFRKVREVFYASALEERYSKDDLLQRYLNQVYFGEGSYGLYAASHSFFGVDPAQLTVAQAATLAGKIQAPSRLDPRQDPGAVVARRDHVLRSMAKQGWLAQADLDAALVEPMTLAPPLPPGISRAPHFVDFVKREASRLEELGADPETRSTKLLTGGYTVETTLDPKLFDATTAAVTAQLGEPGDPITAVASVVPGDGAVNNLFGGLDYLSTQFGYADRGVRQAGSAFKPFVYLAALRDGIDPRTVFDGTSGRRIPCYGDRPVNNYAGEDFGGAIDVNSALARSVNVVFVDLGCQVGVHDVVRTATDAGIPRDATEAQGAVFLGGLDRGVSPLSMAGAYATFASGGIYAEPYGIKAIRDSRGNIVYEHGRKAHRAFDATQVGVLNGALQRVIGEGTGRAAGLGRPAAGKTGTTEENVDAWFVGYVPQVSTAVWVGYDPARPMTDVHRRSVTGGSFPAAIFGDLMRTGLAGTPVRRLPVAPPDALHLRPTGEVIATTTSSTTPSSATTVPSTPLPDTPVTIPTFEPATTTTTRPAPTTTTTRPPKTTTTTAPPPTTSTTTTTPTAAS
jgi:membrane peptidoglycan carboxypeptidase